MMNVEELLCEEIKQEIRELRTIQRGTEEFTVRVNNLAKLLDKAVDFKKIDIDRNLRISQMKEGRRDRIAKYILTTAEIGSYTWLIVWGCTQGWEFEKEGTITSFFSKLFMGKLVPKK